MGVGHDDIWAPESYYANEDLVRSPRVTGGYQKLRSKFNWRRCYPEDASWSLAETLVRETASAAKLSDTAKFAEALAVLRSVMTIPDQDVTRRFGLTIE